MFLRILVCASALSLVTGCVTATSSKPTIKAPEQSSKVSCSKPIKRSVIDIGSSGASLLSGYVYENCNQNALNKYTVDQNYTHNFSGLGTKYRKTLADQSKWAPCKSAGFEELKKLSDTIRKEKNIGVIRAGATAAFRENHSAGAKFIGIVNTGCKLGVDAKILSAAGEGELEFRAVVDKLGTTKSQVPLVWGFGSTSIQLTRRYTDKNGNDIFDVETDLLGADAFIAELCDDTGGKGVTCEEGKFVYPISAREFANIHAAAAAQAAKIDASIATAASRYDIYAIGSPIKYSPWLYKKSNLSNSKCFRDAPASKNRIDCLTKMLAKKAKIQEAAGGLTKDQILEWLKASDEKYQSPEPSFLDSTIGALFVIDAVQKTLLPNKVIYVDTSLAHGLLVIGGWREHADLIFKP